jgi:hypothetical protein
LYRIGEREAEELVKSRQHYWGIKTSNKGYSGTRRAFFDTKISSDRPSNSTDSASGALEWDLLDDTTLGALARERRRWYWLKKGWEVGRSAVGLIAVVLVDVAAAAATAAAVAADAPATVDVVVPAAAAIVAVAPAVAPATVAVAPIVAAVTSVTETCHPTASTDVRACSHKDWH